MFANCNCSLDREDLSLNLARQLKSLLKYPKRNSSPRAGLSILRGHPVHLHHNPPRHRWRRLDHLRKLLAPVYPDRLRLVLDQILALERLLQLHLDTHIDKRCRIVSSRRLIPRLPSTDKFYSITYLSHQPNTKLLFSDFLFYHKHSL